MLRPDHPTEGRPKRPEEYTKEERISAIEQIENASHVRAADEKAVAFAHKLRDGKGGDDVVLDGRDLDINTKAVAPATGALNAKNAAAGK